MNSIRTTPATKGKFKCFHCRVLTMAKDGAWQIFAKKQVFLCKSCNASADVRAVLNALPGTPEVK